MISRANQTRVLTKAKSGNKVLLQGNRLRIRLLATASRSLRQVKPRIRASTKYLIRFFFRTRRDTNPRPPAPRGSGYHHLSFQPHNWFRAGTRLAGNCLRHLPYAAAPFRWPVGDGWGKLKDSTEIDETQGHRRDDRPLRIMNYHERRARPGSVSVQRSRKRQLWMGCRGRRF